MPYNIDEIKLHPGFEIAKIHEILQMPNKLMILKNIIRDLV